MGNIERARRRSRELRAIVFITIIVIVATMILASFYVRMNAQVHREMKARDRDGFDTETFIIWEEHVRAARSYIEFGAGAQTNTAPFIAGGRVSSLSGDYSACELRRVEDMLVSAAVRQGRLDHVCVNLKPSSDARMDIDWLEAGLAYTRAAASVRAAMDIATHDFAYINGPFGVACALSLLSEGAIDTSSLVMLSPNTALAFDGWSLFFEAIASERAPVVLMRPRETIDREKLANLLAFFLRNP